MRVPLIPFNAKTALSRLAMVAVPPVFAKDTAAWTFGSILPGAKCPSLQYCSASRIVIWDSAFWSGFPQLIATRSTAVNINSISA